MIYQYRFSIPTISSRRKKAASIASKMQIRVDFERPIVKATITSAFDTNLPSRGGLACKQTHWKKSNFATTSSQEDNKIRTLSDGKAHRERYAIAYCAGFSAKSELQPARKARHLRQFRISGEEATRVGWSGSGVEGRWAEGAKGSQGFQKLETTLEYPPLQIIHSLLTSRSAGYSFINHVGTQRPVYALLQEMEVHESPLATPLPIHPADEHNILEDEDGRREAQELRPMTSDDNTRAVSERVVARNYAESTARQSSRSSQPPRFYDGVKRWWRRHVVGTVPHVACRDHLGTSWLKTTASKELTKMFSK